MRRQIADQTLAESWKNIRAELRDSAGAAAFDGWIRDLTLESAEEGRVVVSAPNNFIRDGVGQRFGDDITALWRAQDLGIKYVDIITRTGGKPGPHPPGSGLLHIELPQDDSQTGNTEDILELSEPTFDRFIIGKSNELALAAARRVAETPVPTFNPLFFHSGVGLGKTHLMLAIRNEIAKLHPGRKVMYLTAETFMYRFISALRQKNTMDFKEEFRNVDVLMIDDVHFIAGKDSTQEEFFHTFNTLMEQKKQIVLSADKAPTELEGVEERITSRLGWGLVVDIHPTDFELRLGILQDHAERLLEMHPDIEIPAPVLEYIAQRVSKNVRELQGAFTRLVAHATLVDRPVTLDMTKELLRDLVRASDRKHSIEEIQRRVAEHYNVRIADMLSPRRSRAIARPRQIAMYLSKMLTTRSLPDIGRKFGGRDHTTVIHAVKTVEKLRESDTSFDEQVEVLRRKLEA